MLSVKHPLVAVACLCLRPFPRCGRLISVGHQVNAPSESGLIIFYQFIATFAAEPSPCWAKGKLGRLSECYVIYYLHYTLITIIANIIICFHVELSVRPSRVRVPRSRSLIKFALLSLSLTLSSCRGSRRSLLLARSLLCIFRFILPIFHLIYELSTLGWPSRYLPNDKYSFYSPPSSHALSVSVSFVHKYVYLHTSINTDTFYLLHFFYN